MSTKIEWTKVRASNGSIMPGDTWNPLIGCDKISAGCKNCYAIKTAWIRQHNPAMDEKYAGVVEKAANGSLNWTGKINFHQPSLLKPLNTKKPTVFFVNSMSDLFHEDVPFEYIDAIFSVMSDCNWHIYQVLTKRAERMYEFFEWKKRRFNIPWQPKNNIWIGVSVENQKAANERIPFLMGIPAAVRFLSCEPLLNPVDLTKIEHRICSDDAIAQPLFGNIETLDVINGERIHGRIGYSLPKISWVIVGGESGKDARSMHPDWVRDLRDQCAKGKIPFFFKQWGEYLPMREHVADAVYPDGTTPTEYENATEFKKVGKKSAGRLLDGQLHDEYPIVSK